uniref:Uncharacterized protein n=1 Tax=Hyaloperonospora arabidopsidis (strain Emoy2) TaxID=559515 RepID=M4BQ09_HYAAE
MYTQPDRSKAVAGSVVPTLKGVDRVELKRCSSGILSVMGRAITCLIWSNMFGRRSHWMDVMWCLRRGKFKSESWNEASLGRLQPVTATVCKTSRNFKNRF